MRDECHTSLSTPAGFDALWRAWIETHEPSALGMLMEREQGLLCARAARLGTAGLPGAPQPLDLVQDVFVKARQSIAGFRGETHAQWRVWLCRILLHEWLRRARRREHRMAALRLSTSTEGAPGQGFAPLFDPRTPPSQAAIRDERRRALLAAVDRLPPVSRQILIAHEIEGRTFEEVGEGLGLSPEAARQRCNRALRRLKVELGFLYESG